VHVVYLFRRGRGRKAIGCRIRRTEVPAMAALTLNQHIEEVEVHLKKALKYANLGAERHVEAALKHLAAMRRKSIQGKRA
jgi:hypothetical protein